VRFKPDVKLSMATSEEIEKFYNDLDSEISNEEFLRSITRA
jgi:hypothetical protein